MMDSDHASKNNHDTVEIMKQELVDLRMDGSTKRRRRRGEMELRQQRHDALFSKWKRASQKQPLHLYKQELTDANHLIPQKILGKQAKLAQCLHLMEVYLQQTSLIEKQHREYAQLLAQQAGQEEEEQSKVTLELMNDLCVLDAELHEMKEKLKELGCSHHDADDEEKHEKEKDTNDTFSQQQQEETHNNKNPWWWPIQHGDEKQKPPLTSSTMAAADTRSVASDASSLMDLLWMPAKFKPQAISPKQQQVDSLPVTTVAIAEHHHEDSSAHSSNGSSSYESLEQQTKAVPVMARQWWPTVSNKQDAATTELAEEEHGEEEENPQHWWESFYRS